MPHGMQQRHHQRMIAPAGIGQQRGVLLGHRMGQKERRLPVGLQRPGEGRLAVCMGNAAGGKCQRCQSVLRCPRDDARSWRKRKAPARSPPMQASIACLVQTSNRHSLKVLKARLPINCRLDRTK